MVECIGRKKIGGRLKYCCSTFMAYTLSGRAHKNSFVIKIFVAVVVRVARGGCCVCTTSKCISSYYFHVNDELFYLHVLAVYIVHTSNLHYYRAHLPSFLMKLMLMMINRTNAI